MLDFSVVLCLSYVSCLVSLSLQAVPSLFCVTFFHCLSFFHCISSILWVFVCFVCLSLSFLRQLSIFFVFTSRSFSVLRHCLSMSFVLPLYFVNSLRLCLLSLSLFVFPTSVLSFLCLCQWFLLFLASLRSNCISSFHCISSILYVLACFLCRSLPFPRHFFCFSVFVSRSFSFLRHCCLIVFRSSTVLRQFSSPLFAFSVDLCVSLSVL